MSQVFARARADGRAVLVGYLPAGFPSVAGGIAAVRALAEAGADVVEVGLPYSDPTMDGPVIQAASDAALRRGVTTADVLRTVEAVAVTGVPALVMTYWNPIERYGVDAFARDLAAAGGAGAITPDLPPEEAGPWLAATADAGLDSVFLVAPSSTDARLARVAAVSKGFIYAASLMGVTGTRERVGAQAADLTRRVRAVTDTPVAVGLGVSTPEQAAEVAGFADGVIVGSALVKALLEAERAGADPGEAEVALRGIVAGLAAGVRRPEPSVPRG
ncbi:tryptophan synthase subunit alpha [Protofrankia sp. BMG5.30]|uniref:Tryptophan synthase alpha chain n=1 Tax=Protofrankia coriariae TaxID=1562887 RepID=A0ABR5F7C2_9ACTN|nr:tryptophan synthase subunit alpha [Protofrankia coriariae]ONH35561.1 tryptophan synthase subunit alpha [Protofrankia sp. BMG5.30]